MASEFYEQEEENSAFDFHQILSIAKRRFFFFLIPAIIIGVVTITVAFLLPARFESSGTVLVESQQIPVELVQSTVTSNPNQRITVIKQRVMTRNNLLRIIDKYDVFVQERKKLSVTRIIEEMQRLISVDVITAGANQRGPTIAFRVSFQHESPATATKVANELVTLFLSENVKTRTARATETTEFLEAEAEKLKKDLLAAEAAISEYKRENNENLPEHLNLRLARLERTKGEIRSIDRQLSNLQDERRYLDIELSSAKNGTDPNTGETASETETERELRQLKDALINASVRLTDAHPDIRSLKRRIAVLEKKVADEANLSEDDDIDRQSFKGNAKLNKLISQLEIRMNSNSNNQARLRKELKELKLKEADIEERILKTPDVERELITLTRNHREIFQKYTELQAKQGKAQLAQNLEEEKKAERFILLEPPIMPSEPVWPNRFNIVLIGCVVAFASGVGTAFLVELIDKRIRTASELEALLRHPPLVAIPFIQNHRDVKKKRYKLGMVLILPLLVGVAGLFAINTFYKPLDVLFYRAWVYLDKLSILPF